MKQPTLSQGCSVTDGWAGSWTCRAPGCGSSRYADGSLHRQRLIFLGLVVLYIFFFWQLVGFFFPLLFVCLFLFFKKALKKKNLRLLKKKILSPWRLDEVLLTGK